MFFLDHGTIRCGGWWYRCFTVGSLVGPSCLSSFKGLALCSICFAKASSDLYSTGWWWEIMMFQGSELGEFGHLTQNRLHLFRQQGLSSWFADKSSLCSRVWVKISESGRWNDTGQGQRCLRMFPHRYHRSKTDYRRLGTSWNWKVMYVCICIYI